MTTHVSCFTAHGYLKHLLLSFHKFAPYALKGLFHANLLHTLLELFPVTDGTILDFGAIIIDSVH